MTFTLTQIADAYLWTLNNKQGEGGLQACTSYQMQFGTAPGGEIDYPNFVVSKYVIPLIVFSQHVRAAATSTTDGVVRWVCVSDLMGRCIRAFMFHKGKGEKVFIKKRKTFHAPTQLF